MPLLRMSLLKVEPRKILHSLDELFSLAYVMKREAADRYTGLADDMKRQGKHDLAVVFAELADAEREQVRGVARWSHERVGRTPDPMLLRWEVPETVDADETAEIESSRLMTPYRALSIAVRNEERAFALWSYLAAFADDAEVKQAAEAMAREELSHVAALRQQRRRAYHREYGARRAGGSAGVRQIDAAELERRLAGHLADLERGLAGASAERAGELLRETTAMMEDAAGVGRFPSGRLQGDAEELAEILVDAYLESAETACEPARLERLQGLAARAIVRLAWLRLLNMKKS